MNASNQANYPLVFTIPMPACPNIPNIFSSYFVLPLLSHHNPRIHNPIAFPLPHYLYGIEVKFGNLGYIFHKVGMQVTLEFNF